MNKYEILQTIGQGEYGVVLKAKNKQTGDLVAIKKFKEDDSDEENKRVILRQVKILKTLNHENIIELKQAFRKKGKIYLVCEYVDKNLLELMEVGSITAHQLKNYAYQMLKGIAYMHSLNIIHRDIKPENVLISRSNFVKICDLGFARNIPNNNKMTDYVATRWYRPPELILGRDEYDKSIDVWAVGCVMAEMIDGEPLFGGQNDLDQLYLIQKCLGPLSPQQNQYFLKNPKFVGMKFPEIHSLETLQRRYIGKIDKLGIDLLKKMLKMDPSARITAEQALNHPFFNRSTSQAQLQFKKTNYRDLINLQQHNFIGRGGHLSINNFINDNISSRVSKEESRSLNKGIGIVKIKKNQQQTQYFQDSVDQDVGATVGSKAKSLGKKNTATGPTNSIRDKNGERAQRNLIKALKSNINQIQPSKKNEKIPKDYDEEYYDDEFEKQQPETGQMYTKNSRDSKISGFQQSGQPQQNSWNLSSNIFQGVHGKSKQKVLTNRVYGKETESPSKEQYQKIKKNFKNFKKDNISIVFNNNTYNLNVVDN